MVLRLQAERNGFLTQFDRRIGRAASPKQVRAPAYIASSVIAGSVRAVRRLIGAAADRFRVMCSPALNRADGMVLMLM